MTAQNDPYVRVYYRAMDDEKFQGLSLAGWGLWLRLLVVADGMYPAAAQLPRWVEDAALDELTSRGIVDVAGDAYRIHGMTSERERRAEAARAAAQARWDAAALRPHSDGNAGALQAHPTADATAMRRERTHPTTDASPLRSAPIREAPLRRAPAREAPPATVNGGGAPTPMRDLMRPVKAPPEDDERADQLKAKYADSATSDEIKRAVLDQLGFMGWNLVDGEWAVTGSLGL